jgi:hypothetical protein
VRYPPDTTAGIGIGIGSRDVHALVFHSARCLDFGLGVASTPLLFCMDRARNV